MADQWLVIVKRKKARDTCSVPYMLAALSEAVDDRCRLWGEKKEILNIYSLLFYKEGDVRVVCVPWAGHVIDI